MTDREMDAHIRYLSAKADLERIQLDSFITGCKKFVEGQK